MVLNFIELLTNNKLLVMLLTIIALLVIVAVMWIIKGKKEKITSKKIASLGIFTAFSIVLYFLKFNLPFIFPSFLEINFSLLPIIIVGFMFGPVEGITVVLLRAIIKIPFTSTFCVGELADALIGIPVVLVSSLIYIKFHSKKGALISLLFGVFTWIFAAVLANYFINVPFFIQLYCNGNVSAFLGALSIIPGVTEENYLIKYLFLAVVPFNGLLSILVSTVTFLVYKKISILFNKLGATNA
jgi:riboflavin transporter FmnP